MQSSGSWKAVTLLLAIVVSEYGMWRSFPDPFVAFYTGVFVLVLVARVFEWPSPTWLAQRHLTTIRRRTEVLGLRGIAAGTQVHELKERRGVKEYFASVVYNENTHTLCNEIVGNLPPKIVIYGVVVLLYVYLAKRKPDAAHDELETVLKGGAAVIISLFPLFWDFARCEAQKYFNKELREPE